MTTYNYQLVAPTDENRSGTDTDGAAWQVGGWYLQPGRPGSASTLAISGIVFPLDVPQAATINSSSLQLYNLQTGQGNKTYRIYADSALTQANFTSSDLPSVASRTTAFGSITNPTNTADTAWAAIDIASVIQEIVNKGGWVQGNLVRLIIVAQSPSIYCSNNINAAGSYSNTSNEPSIAVDYTAGGSSTTITPSVGSALIQGRAPSANPFTNVRIREVFINEAGSPVSNKTGLQLLVWYAGNPVGAPDLSYSNVTTDLAGTMSWSLATGTLIYNQQIFYVSTDGGASLSMYTCARMTPTYS